MSFFRAEKRARRYEMAFLQYSVGLIIDQATSGGGDVVHQIAGPSQSLLDNNAEQGVNRGVLGKIIKPVELPLKVLDIFRVDWWHEIMVFSKVICIYVVPSVGRPPGKVRGEESRMEYEAYCVIEIL